MSKTFTNPIIPGFYPDPTICRVGTDYYIVTSSFELFPALPIFHSKDLVNWKQIGHALDKKDWLYVDANLFSGGMMAPTLRYYDGVYYIMCCNFADSGNFMITAHDPAGPWSEPILLPEVNGIDASMFFDNDGTCYVTSTGQYDFPEGREQAIWGAKFDSKTGKLLSEPTVLWRTALRGAPSPEAPHLYHIGNWYYLITAEGGTELYHSVVVARSKEPLGKYEGNPANPIMTHRHLGRSYPIGNPGHADLVETQNGEWYAVLLASRLVDGFHKNLGRETYLVPVIWENEWPVFCPETGKIEFEYPAPNLPEGEEVSQKTHYDSFDNTELDMRWTFWGTPYQDFWKSGNGALKIKALPRPLARPLKKIDMSKAPEKLYDDNAACVLRRQCQPNVDVSCKIKFSAKGSECAGLIMMQQCNHQLRVEKWEDKIKVVLAECNMDCPPFLPMFEDSTRETVICEKPYADEEAVMGLKIEGQAISVFCNGELLCEADGKRINPEELGPMTGTMLGMFATANETQSDAWAEFDWFRYQEQ